MALLRESGQCKSLIADGTHLVLASGKPVRQKSLLTFLIFVKLRFDSIISDGLKFTQILLSRGCGLVDQ